MKVVYIGYPKTGTKTVAAALKLLGFSVYDFDENSMYLQKEWTKILMNGSSAEDFRKMYSNVDATMDTPVHMYWEEFLEAFPDVKFIFSHRDDDAWLKSWNKQQSAHDDVPLWVYLLAITPTMFRFGNFCRLMSRVCFGGYQNTWPWHLMTGITDQAVLKRYHQHNIEVQQKVPKSKLLEINYKDGWKPLCDFLDVPIPNVPFPHENKNASVVAKAMETSILFTKARKELKTILPLFAAGLIAITAFIFCY